MVMVHGQPSEMDTDPNALSGRSRSPSATVPSQFASALIAFVALVAGGIVYSITESAVGVGASVTGVVAALCGVASALGIALLAPRVVTRRTLVLCLLGSTVLPAIAIPFAATTFQRSACGNWLFVAEGFLADYRASAFEAIERGDDLPPSIALWVADGTLDDTYFTSRLCGRFTLGDVRVGAWTVDDLRRGRITREQLGAAAASSPADNWETLGPFSLCRETVALASNHPDLIVGFQNQVESPDHQHLAFVFADWRTRTFWADSLESVVAADAAVRRDLGLSATPEVGPIALGIASRRAKEAAEEQ